MNLEFLYLSAKNPQRGCIMMVTRAPRARALPRLRPVKPLSLKKGERRGMKLPKEKKIKKYHDEKSLYTFKLITFLIVE